MKRLLAALLLLMLTAGCAAPEEIPAASPEATAAPPEEAVVTVEPGTYRAVFCSDGKKEYLCPDDALVLEADGSGLLIFEGREYPMQWSLSENGFSFADAEGDVFEGRAADGVIEGCLGGVYNFVFVPGAGTAEEETPFESGFELRFVGAETFWDIHGSAALRIYYDFTNTSDKTTSAAEQLKLQAEQAGRELLTTVDRERDNVPEYGNRWLAVRPGVTVRCVEEYEYDPNGGPVSLSIGHWRGGEVLAATLDPEGLPGRPEEEWAPAPIPSPAMEAAASGECEKGLTVAITGGEKVAEWYGGEALRVCFDVTNGGAEAVSFYYGTRYRAFQDGVELESGWAARAVAADGNAYEELDPGESLNCAAVWVLRSGSPVEVELYSGGPGGEVFVSAVFAVEEPAALR